MIGNIRFYNIFSFLFNLFLCNKFDLVQDWNKKVLKAWNRKALSWQMMKLNN